MSLYERYELLDLNRDIGVKTFEAREIATGRPVKVHLFVHPSAPLQAAILKAIDKLPDEERKRIIERGKHEGTPWVVTDRLMDYDGLSEWVQAVGNQSKPGKAVLETAGAWKFPSSPAQPSAAPAPATRAPIAVPVTEPVAELGAHSALDQQFTELFATAQRPVVSDTLLQAPERPRNIAAPVRPPDPQPATAPGPPQVKSEPGEFTRMFQAPVVAPPPSPQIQTQPVAPPPPVRTPPPAAKEPGEFTRMFQAPAGSMGVPSPTPPAAPIPPATSPYDPAPAAARSGPGEFTRFFETPSPAGPLPPSPAVQQPLAPQAPGRLGYNQVSEFTRTFGKGAVEVPPPPPAPHHNEPGEFTRMFHSPGASAKPAVADSPTVQVPLAAPQAPAQPRPPTGGATQRFSIPTPAPAALQPSGPGEYTRQFSAPAQLTFGQTSATPSAPVASPSPQAFAPPAMAQPAMPNMTTQPPAKKSNLPLILGVVGIVLVAVLLIVFFAMRPK